MVSLQVWIIFYNLLTYDTKIGYKSWSWITLIVHIHMLYIFLGSCATGNGPSIQVVENGVSKEVRFSITSFYFQGYNNVYIFCDARLCMTSSGSCSKVSDFHLPFMLLFLVI